MGCTAGASPRSVLGGGDAAAYLADLVDQLGDDCAHSCYWQTNYWSSLRQLARPLPSVDTSFQVRCPTTTMRSCHLVQCLSDTSQAAEHLQQKLLCRQCTLFFRGDHDVGRR